MTEMSEPTFASLSPTLLARKGGAKPAMRRQSIAVAGAVAYQPSYPVSAPDEALEDLGWNDLGENVSPTHEGAPHDNDEGEADEIVTHVADVDFGSVHAGNSEADDNDAGDDSVATQFASLGKHASSTATTRDEAARKVTPIHTNAPRLPHPRLAVANTVRSAEKGADTGKRTAFTLRLDRERHLKLRLASTLAGQSAQALVTQAVDAMFADIPELDALVARVQSRPSKEG